MASNVQHVENRTSQQYKCHKVTQSAIKYVATAPAKKLFSFDLKSEALQEFKLITKNLF